jgi:hypothetical protein
MPVIPFYYDEIPDIDYLCMYENLFLCVPT